MPVKKQSKTTSKKKPVKEKLAPAKNAGSAFDQLTPKQQVFVKEYIVDFNGTRAAIESGCPRSSADVIGSQYLDHPKICRAIAEALKPMMDEAQLSAERIIKQLVNFLFYDITPYITADGMLKCEPSDLPENVRQSIIGFSGDQSFDKDGGISHSKVSLKLINKEGALKLAMQYLKMLQPDTTQLNIQQNFFDRFYQQASQPASGPVIVPAIPNGVSNAVP